MLRARLLAMGLNLGREVDVIQNNRGLIIVGVNGGRVALGRGISQKILAEPVLPLLTDQRPGRGCFRRHGAAGLPTSMIR